MVADEQPLRKKLRRSFEECSHAYWLRHKQSLSYTDTREAATDLGQKILLVQTNKALEVLKDIKHGINVLNKTIKRSHVVRPPTF